MWVRWFTRAEKPAADIPVSYTHLHAFLIELIRDYDRALAETEAFLPYINNWATCDCFCPKAFAKHKKELLVPIRRWLDSGETYTCLLYTSKQLDRGIHLGPPSPGTCSKAAKVDGFHGPHRWVIVSLPKSA